MYQFRLVDGKDIVEELLNLRYSYEFLIYFLDAYRCSLRFASTSFFHFVPEFPEVTKETCSF